jgi:preprotein translocase subunit SecA
MSFINSIIKVFVGDKSQKDVKALQPYLNKIKTFEAPLMSLSNDELRGRTVYFKDRIKVLLIMLIILMLKRNLN